MPSRMGKQDVDRELDVMFSALFDALRPSVIAMVRDLQRAQQPDDYADRLAPARVPPSPEDPGGHAPPLLTSAMLTAPA